MHILEDISSRKEELLEAILPTPPFVPLYIKLKLSDGCNPKDGMCDQWPECREALPAADGFTEIVQWLAERGPRKIQDARDAHKCVENMLFD